MEGTHVRKGEASSGFTLAELLVAMAILLVVLAGTLTAVTYAATATRQNAMRENATDLASRELEYARTIPYDNLGTQSTDGTLGDPPGSLLVSETVGDFTVKRTVGWVRDAGTGRATYKRVVVEVSWAKPIAGSVSVETGIYGKDTSSNTGDVEITVLDADDLTSVLPGATITLTPPSGASRWVTSDSSGMAFFGYVPYGSTLSDASKAGWMADLASFGNNKVLADTLNRWTLLMQVPSEVIARVVDSSGAAVPGASVTLINAERSLAYNGTTGSSGEARFGELWATRDPGGYYTVSASKTGYTGASQSFPIPSGGLQLTQTLVLRQPLYLEVTCVANPSETPINGATVIVTTKATGEVVGTKTTSADGVVTFEIPGLGDYEIVVQPPSSNPFGYQLATEEKHVANGSGTEKVKVKLTPTDGALSVTTAKRNVSLTLERKNGSTWETVTTASSGSSRAYTFVNLDPGTYRVRTGTSPSYKYTSNQVVSEGVLTSVSTSW